MPKLRSLPIRLIGFILIGLAIGGSSYKYYLINQIQKARVDYEEKALKKESLYHQILKGMGYGGGIHHFKNYILRGDEKYYTYSKAFIEESLLNLEEFAEMYPKHGKDLNSVKAVFLEYYNNLDKAHHLKSVVQRIELDKRVKVDDGPALKALSNIDRIMKEDDLLFVKKLNDEERHLKSMFLWTTMLVITSIGFFSFLLYKSAQEAGRLKLKEASQKEEFIRRMAHEIRTPLNGIIGFQDLLKDETLSKEGQENLELLTRASKYLLRLINDIMDFSKLRAKKVSLEPVDFELKKFFYTTEGIGNALKKPLQEFTVELDQELPKYIHQDSLRLKQAILNLVSNAFKFSQGKPVRLIASSFKDKLLIKVIDKGIGIDERGTQNLFKDFHQIESTGSLHKQGTGLGLSITKDIVSLMGGKIEVVSHPGSGSIFSLIIPYQIALPPEKSMKTSESKLNRPLIESVGILVVEDNKVNQKLMIRYLEKLGVVDFEIAENGRLALERVKKKNFCIIFMDYQMPEMDGIEATREIIKYCLEEGKPKPKIIGLSANHEQREDCLRSGMDDFLEKPIRKEVLLKYLTIPEEKEAS